jgi:hypothetical protein
MISGRRKAHEVLETDLRALNKLLGRMEKKEGGQEAERGPFHFYYKHSQSRARGKIKAELGGGEAGESQRKQRKAAVKGCVCREL